MAAALACSVPPARRTGDTTPGVLARGVTGLPRGDAGPGDSGRGALDPGALLGLSGLPASPPVRGVPMLRSPATVGRPPEAGGVAPGGRVRLSAEGGDTAPLRGVRFDAVIAGVGDAMLRGRTAPPAGLDPGDRGLVRGGTGALTAALWPTALPPGRDAAVAGCLGDTGGACVRVRCGPAGQPRGAGRAQQKAGSPAHCRWLAGSDAVAPAGHARTPSQEAHAPAVRWALPASC